MQILLVKYSNILDYLATQKSLYFVLCRSIQNRFIKSTRDFIFQTEHCLKMM